MIENYLIKHCSPTLAGLRTAGLFTYNFLSEKDLLRQIDFCNLMLNHKDVYVTVLKKKENSSLIYVYRKSKLSEDMNRQGVADFLKKYGYEHTDVKCLLNELIYKFQSCDTFPHEIGLFLGYPLSDVIGFIENSGKNSKATGYWKVYGDVADAIKQFNKFNKCRRVYERLYKEGATIQKLTVAA